MKVLVGEDDSAIAEVVDVILSEAGHEVIKAPTEKSFHQSLSKKPQIILLDISLGGADGGVIASSLKKNPKYSSIPLIIMSANTDTEIIANKSGANGFLLKPFDMDDLLELVSSYSIPLS